ncbi:MAG: hypothetical protein VX980_05285 [Actinomycetota bacterium]|nr:hypothetical protein [Actinomycetota bacterium]
MTTVLRPPRAVRPSEAGAPHTFPTKVHLSGVLSLARMGLVAVLAFFAVLFAVASFHGVVIGEQFEFDRLQQRLDEGRQRAQVLRNEVARLESPERVLAVAEGRLGLGPPGERPHLAVVPAGGSAPLLRPPVGNPFAGGSR